MASASERKSWSLTRTFADLAPGFLNAPTNIDADDGAALCGTTLAQCGDAQIGRRGWGVVPQQRCLWLKNEKSICLSSRATLRAQISIPSARSSWMRVRRVHFTDGIPRGLVQRLDFGDDFPFFFHRRTSATRPAHPIKRHILCQQLTPSAGDGAPIESDEVGHALVATAVLLKPRRQDVLSLATALNGATARVTEPQRWALWSCMPVW